uniref:2-iminobutanoate/2-iminopropanoate deaminase n=1 Tax=Canis lupus dingo TaxID=286419 RepID=A0A8C0JNG7_CANLU
MFWPSEAAVAGGRAPSAGAPVTQTTCISAQLGRDPSRGQLVPGGPVEEAKQALINTDEILKAAGCDFTNVKTTVLLAAMNDFSAVKIYKQLFKSSFPTTAAHQVVALPKGGHVETHAGAVQGSLTTASL